MQCLCAVGEDRGQWVSYKSPDRRAALLAMWLRTQHALSGEWPEARTAARDALVAAGVLAERIVFATGWGKLYPVCMQAGENCWAQNRRAHFSRW